MQPQTAEPATQARRKIALPATYLKLEESVVRRYHTFVPLGHTPDDLLDPSYWVHWAQKLRANYTIRVRAEDGSFDGELLVLSAGDTWAKCVWFVFNRRDNGELAAVDQTPARAQYKIEPTAKGWRVIEKASGKVLEKDLPNKADAEKAVDLYIESLKTN